MVQGLGYLQRFPYTCSGQYYLYGLSIGDICEICGFVSHFLEGVTLSSTTTTYGKSSRLVGSLAALGAVSIWGLTFVPTKIAMMEMGALTLSVLRFALALLIMAALAWRLYPNSHNPRNVSWGTLALLGFTSVTLFFGFQNLGLARTSATEAGMLSASVPALTAVLAALVYKERVGGFDLSDRCFRGGCRRVVLVGSGSESGKPQATCWCWQYCILGFTHC